MAADEGVTYRPATPGDVELLTRMLWLAFNWRDEKILLERAAADRLPALSLSVEPDNAAVRLYRALGFEPVGESGGSVTMLRRVVLRPCAQIA